jgi:hypothetical protein
MIPVQKRCKKYLTKIPPILPGGILCFQDGRIDCDLAKIKQVQLLRLLLQAFSLRFQLLLCLLLLLLMVRYQR